MTNELQKCPDPECDGKPEMKLILGDSVEVLKSLDSEIIDLTVTSPPYGSLREYNGFKFDFQSFMIIATELYRVTKKGGVVVWVVGDQTSKGTESGMSFRQALYFKEIGFNLHDTMIYQKINYVPLTHNRYEQAFEYIFVFSKGKPNTFNPKRIPCKYPNKVEKYGSERRINFGKKHSMRTYQETEYRTTKETKIASNIFSYSLGRERSGHPAPFPEKLAEDQILSWSNPEDMVLDPFVGSGTTGKMSLVNNRNFIGIDCSKEYLDLAKNRISQAVESRTRSDFSLE